LANHCMRFGWNLAKYIDNGMLEIFGFTMISIDDVLDIIDGYKPSRVVFDSINLLDIFSTANVNVRQNIMMRNLLKLVKKERIITLITTEKTYGIEQRRFDQFDFIGDGLIFMDRLIDNGFDRFVMSIRKMRGTIIDAQPKVFEITKRGIELYSDAIVVR
ncbi:MAG: RAD55 family ATPase, partial [Methanosarcinales archaeon]